MTYWVAELGGNHNGETKRVRRMAELARLIGCQAIKLQAIPERGLFRDEVARHPVITRDLLNAARIDDIHLGCSVFRVEDVGWVSELVDFLKISSYDLLRDDLIRESAYSGKPLILSTGMSTMEEVGHAVEVARVSGARDITVLHCVSLYPAPPDSVKLSSIHILKQCYHFDPLYDIPIHKVGWSDHSRNPAVLYCAVLRWHAAVVEFHLDIDGEGSEYKHGHCWLPYEIAPVMDTIEQAENCSGDGVKSLTEAELEERKWRADPFDGLRPML